MNEKSYNFLVKTLIIITILGLIAQIPFVHNWIMELMNSINKSLADAFLKSIGF